MRTPLLVSTLARGPFAVYDSSNAPVTGLVTAGFTFVLLKDGASQSTAGVAIVEGASGAYEAQWTPASTGVWTLIVRHATHNPRGWIETFDVRATDITALQADLDDVQARLPAALVGGRIDASVGAMAANVVTAAAIATDAIDADALKADAVTEIQAGLATSSALATAQADLDALELAVADVDADVGVAIAGVAAVAGAVAALPSAAATATAVGALTKDGHTLLTHLGNQSAMLAGKITGGPGSVVARSVDDARDAVEVVADEDGNRSSTVFHP